VEKRSTSIERVVGTLDGKMVEYFWERVLLLLMYSHLAIDMLCPPCITLRGVQHINLTGLTVTYLPFAIEVVHKSNIFNVLRVNLYIILPH
jgi:hypothetical protein